MRGCPHRCTYCNNVRLISMFGNNHIRFKGVDKSIEVIEQALALHPYNGVWISDDDFFLRSKSVIEDYVEKYKSRIGLPLGMQVSANNYTNEKLEILMDAGLIGIMLGVQSRSQRIMNEVFDRKVSVARARKVVNEIKAYQNGDDLRLILDFIIDNPYENENDIIQTYKFICDLPDKPTVIKMFSLAFYPGTPLYDKAVKDGYITPFNEESLRYFFRNTLTFQRNYVTFLLLVIKYLHRKGLRSKIPAFILDLLVSRPVIFVMRIFPKSLWVYLSHFRRGA